MAAEPFTKLEDLDSYLTDKHLIGFWAARNEARVQEEIKPYLWKWADIYPALLNAAELVPMESVAMRTLQPRNPGLVGRMSNTLHFSIQVLMPGERTKAHRNLVSETRFVLQAPKGAHYVVDGEAYEMGVGDLIATPNWSWHDHYNGGGSPAVWLDGMDTRLVMALGKPMNEPFPTLHQPVERPAGYSEHTLGHARPAWVENDSVVPPPFHYRWSETVQTLDTLRANEIEGSPYDGVHLTFRNPVTGGPTLPTYSCEISLLGPKFQGKARRENCTTVYHAFRGRGATEVDGQRFEWSQGDIWVVPPWTWHQHENLQDGDSLLYSITDEPALKALGLYREESR
jgi:gentisate 1,2-dioxygenase